MLPSKFKECICRFFGHRWTNTGLIIGACRSPDYEAPIPYVVGCNKSCTRCGKKTAEYFYPRH